MSAPVLEIDGLTAGYDHAAVVRIHQDALACTSIDQHPLVVQERGGVAPEAEILTFA